MAAIFAIAIAAAVLYPVYSQVVPGVEGAAATNSTASADPASSIGSDPPTSSASVVSSAASTTATTQAPPQGQFDSTWISQFFSIVDANRGGPDLTRCAHLDSFAAHRFQTLTTGTNWEVLHFGYEEDLRQAYGGSAGYYAEEYLYPVTPSYRTPAGFAEVVRTTAPGHWSDLVDPLYHYVGVYTGTGPILLFSPKCGPSELSAGVNQTQLYSSCPHQQVSGTWFVIELASKCV